MRTRTRSLLAAGLLVALAACGSGGSGSTASPQTTAASAPEANDTPTTTSATAASATTVPPGGAPASDAGATAPESIQFSAPLVGGGELDLSQYAGTAVALWFWAPT